MTDDFTGADFAPASSTSTSSADSGATSTLAVDASAAPPVGATTPPAQETTVTTDPGAPPAGQTPPGPIPFTAHKTALENARTKAVEEWRQKFGWAESVDQGLVHEAVRIATLAKTDKLAFVQNLVSELQQDPVHGPQLRSMAARALAAARGQQPAAPQGEPQFFVTQPDGSVAFDPTAFGQWKDWHAKSLLSQMQQQMAPVVKTHQQLQAEREQVAHQQQVTAYVETTHADVLTWPGMDDAANRKTLAEHLKQMPVRDDPSSVSLALNTAYRQVILPKLHTSARSDVLHDINQRARGNTVNPARPQTQSPKTMEQMSIAEALAHVAAQSV